MAISFIDRTLRFITGVELPFGGKLIVLGGDFHQGIPIPPKISDLSLHDHLICTAPWWSTITHHKLTIIERVLRAPSTATEAEKFAHIEFLSKVGDGTWNEDGTEMMSFTPSQRCTVICPNPDDPTIVNNAIDNLITTVFPGLDSGVVAKDSVILAPKNSDVNFINRRALERLAGEATISLSSDTIVEADSGSNDAETYPVEFLNTVNPPGMPRHELLLKVGAMIIVLRNLSRERGLVNGTRAVIIKINEHSIYVELLNGSMAGTRCYLCRIDLRTQNASLPFVMKRRQYPVSLAFGMTISKSQGQSLARVGLYLPEPVFAHGQLYVALTRCGDPNATTILLLHDDKIQGFLHVGEPLKVTTKNIVDTFVLNLAKER